MRFFKKFLVIIIILLNIVWLPRAESASAITVTAKANQEFWVDVNMNGAADILGVSFELVYSPSALVSLKTAQAGSLLGADVIFFKETDNTAGKINMSVSRKNGQGGVSGTGNVARVNLLMSAQTPVGQSVSLTLQNIKAIDPLGVTKSVSLDIFADTSAPVISNISSLNIMKTSAKVTWTTSELSDSQVEYGLTTSYGKQTTVDMHSVTSHAVNLSRLSSGKTYHYRVKSKDATGNLSVSADKTFKTK